MSRNSALLIVLVLGIGSSVGAQEAAPRPAVAPLPAVPQMPTLPPVATGVSAFSSDYQVGPGDVLQIQVVGQDDLRQDLRVSNAGEINVSVVGALRVVEMTTFEIEDLLAGRFRDLGLMREPEVLVDVTEYRAKPVSVMGAVALPGEFVMSSTLTAMDAILLAGGLRFNAADEAVLHRRVSTDAVWSPAAMAARPGEPIPGVEVIRLDLRPLKQGQYPPSTAVLRRGDVIVVPEEELAAFFVVGDVIEPHNYFYRPHQTLTVSQAISMASGPTLTAKMSDGRLVRYDESGQRTEKPVDYAAILRGKEPDFPIRPNDIIFIPGSKIKTVAQGMLAVTGNAMMSAAFRIGRTYQMPDAPDRVPQQ